MNNLNGQSVIPRFTEPFTIDYLMNQGNKGVIRKLRHRGKSRNTKGYVEIVISYDIDKRPAAANDRSRLRYWEDDTVAGITGKACLVA